MSTTRQHKSARRPAKIIPFPRVPPALPKKGPRIACRRDQRNTDLATKSLCC
jgi:hypothetical protein